MKCARNLLNCMSSLQRLTIISMNCWQGLVGQIFLQFSIIKDLYFQKRHKISYIIVFVFVLLCAHSKSLLIINFFVILILLIKMVQRRSKPSKSSRTRSNNFLKSRREKNKIRREEVIKNNNLVTALRTKELEELTLEVEEKDDKHEELSNLYDNLFERFELAQKGINELNDSNESLQKQLASRPEISDKSYKKIKAERDKLRGEKMVLTRHNINLRSEIEIKDEKLSKFLKDHFEG